MSKIYIVNKKVVLNLESKEVDHIETGKTYTIGANEAALLQIFIDLPNEVLSKQYLIDNVWGKNGLIVEQGSLMQSVSVCRRSLNDKQGIIISTVRGKGYKFQADIIEEAQPTKQIIAKENKPFTDIWTQYSCIARPLFLLIISIFLGASISEITKPSIEEYVNVSEYNNCKVRLRGREIIIFDSATIYNYFDNYLLKGNDGQTFSYKKGFKGVDCQ